MKNHIELKLRKYFPEIREFSYTKINHAKPFVPSFENKDWFTILYIEKGSFMIEYETGEVLDVKGGCFYFHPPVSLKYQTYDNMISPYSMFRIVIDLSCSEFSIFSTNQFHDIVKNNLPNKPFFNQAPELMIESFKTVIEESIQKKEDYKLQIENSIRQILISMIRSGKQNSITKVNSHPLVKKIQKHISQHLDFDTSIEDLINSFGYSKSKGYQIFYETTGLSPKRFINREKIQIAKTLLAKGDSITDIAFDLGFSSSQSFATIFKRITNSTPTDFKKSH